MARRKKSKKIVSSKPKKKEEKSKFLILFIAAVVVVLIALFGIGLLNPTPLTGTPNQNPSQNPTQGQTQQPSTTVTGDTCSKDAECFLANCKSTPSVVECVNSTHQDTYSEICNNYNDVHIARDTTRCYCNQRICTMVK